MTEPIRFIDSSLSATDANHQDALEAIYAETLDAIVLRSAFPPAALQQVGSVLAERPEDGWSRPNAPVPGIDIRLLGTGAAPTATTPTGPESDAYFESAAQTRDAIRELFGSTLDPFEGVETAIGGVAGGRPVQLPASGDGRKFAACTVRAMPDGEGLMLHHDYHYPLPIYGDLTPALDTKTCISFFVVLQRPTSGGRLCVYALKPDEEGDLPRLPHGALDPQAVHERVPHTFFDLAEGDMIFFGSGRLYHRVEPVVGARSRVTMGGFLAFDEAHERVMYWS